MSVEIKSCTSVEICLNIRRKQHLSMMKLGCPEKYLVPESQLTVGRLFKFQPVCALGPLAYFRWVIDDKLSLDILPPPGWSSKPKANILLPNAVHSCISLCTTDSFETFALFLKSSLM